MKKAKDVIMEHFEEKDAFEKCSVCGLYGTEEEMEKETIIKGHIYVDICSNCQDYLLNGGKIKKRKYFVEELVDIDKEEEETIISGDISY